VLDAASKTDTGLLDAASKTDTGVLNAASKAGAVCFFR